MVMNSSDKLLLCMFKILWCRGSDGSEEVVKKCQSKAYMHIAMWNMWQLKMTTNHFVQDINYVKQTFNANELMLALLLVSKNRNDVNPLNLKN